ncbi:MAG TPA: histidine kinase [Usitatibacteraceae bacterium]|nr:histidine kinase [Usitatibacteraceae bacterium]
MGTIGSLFRASLRFSAREAFAENATGKPAAAVAGTARANHDSRVLRCTTLALHRSEQRLRVAAAVMDEALLIMDRQKAIVFASAKFAALSGCSTDDLVGRPLLGLFDRSERDDIRARFAALSPNHRARYGATLVRGDGRPLPVDVTFERIAAQDDVGPVWWAVLREAPPLVKVPVQPPCDDARRLSCAMQAAQESERKRIAADLHDGLGQMLSAVKFGLQTASGAIGDNETGQARETIDGLVSTVKAALEEVRRLSMNLRPSTLDDLGLVATLTWFVREFESIYRDISVEVEMLAAETDIDEALRLPVFRIVQEAMNNVAKHSHATRVRVRLARDAELLRLTIADNGVGFDPVAVEARKGLERRCGHCCSRERAESCGGTFAVEAAPGRGVTVSATWRLHPAAGS